MKIIYKTNLINKKKTKCINALLTWASDIYIHAVTFKLSLRRSEGHGGRHTNVCSGKVMLCPLSAVHGILTV